ncbi:hypothetical protein [Saccharospirillum mangrovi]|uniref:hypothetical protein n=1 Tax=Saccharospirillum mangrovi TaxID=2161747 RepID=UPI0013008021|nr:hypothetical protein [Saccharospirillum mangrovi]
MSQPMRPNSMLDPVANYEKTWIIAMYILCVAIPLTMMVGPFIGAVIAWIMRKNAETEFAKNHARYQLGVLGKSVVFAVIGLALMFVYFVVLFRADHDEVWLVLIGITPVIFVAGWYGVKTLIGMWAAFQNRTLP